ncbi:hypothetical protein Prudu_006300, partial [Prunus dulcis]
HGVGPNRSSNDQNTAKGKTPSPSPFQPLSSPPQGCSISDKGTVTSASVSPIFPDQSPTVGRLELVGNWKFPTGVTQTSLFSISSVSQPNQSSEAPGVQLTHRRDLRRVQLARTSSRRRRKETTRAIILAPAHHRSVGPVEDFGYGQIQGRLCRILGRSRRKI